MFKKTVFLIFILICTVSFVESSAANSDDDDVPEYRVLLTGFQPFLNYTKNPSGDVAKFLDGSCKSFSFDYGKHQDFSICFDSLLIPVNHTGAKTAADVLDTEIKKKGTVPFASVIHLGLEDSAKGLKIETVAANILAESASSDPIFPNGSSILPITADTGFITLDRVASLEVLQEIIRKATNSNPKEFWSRDAGTYYCNETLYRTLHYVRTHSVLNSVSPRDSGDLLPALFIHLPDEKLVDIASDAAVVEQIAGLVVAAAI